MSTIPSAIRAVCRQHFLKALPVLLDIAGDPEARTSDRVAAIRALGDFGLGRADQAAVHVHAEGGAMLGIIALPALGSGRDPEQAASEARAPLVLPSGAEVGSRK